MTATGSRPISLVGSRRRSLMPPDGNFAPNNPGGLAKELGPSQGQLLRSLGMAPMQPALWANRRADTIATSWPFCDAWRRSTSTGRPLALSWRPFWPRELGSSKCPYHDNPEILVTKEDGDKRYPFELNGDKLFASNEKEKAGKPDSRSE